LPGEKVCPVRYSTSLPGKFIMTKRSSRLRQDNLEAHMLLRRTLQTLAPALTCPPGTIISGQCGLQSHGVQVSVRPADAGCNATCKGYLLPKGDGSRCPASSNPTGGSGCCSINVKYFLRSFVKVNFSSFLFFFFV
jgi:hypothetical protein